MEVSIYWMFYSIFSTAFAIVSYMTSRLWKDAFKQAKASSDYWYEQYIDELNNSND